MAVSDSSKLYPALGDIAFSVFDWERQKKSLLKASDGFYLCGKLQFFGEGSFGLWTQQAEFRFKFSGEWKWEPEQAQDGEWVALWMDPLKLKAVDEAQWQITADSLRACRLCPQIKLMDSGGVSASALKLRSEFLECMKKSLKEMGLASVETPYLVPCPGMEPTLEPFATEWKWGDTSQTYFLPTSPELHLKRLLVQGWTDIFELKTCFRNSEWSEHHQPEFLMLEWYRAFRDLSQIQSDLQSLLLSLYEAGLIEGDLPETQVVTYSELFEEFLNFALTPSTTREELLTLCKTNQINSAMSDSWDDLFFRLSLEKIEPHLKHKGPLIIKNFPPSQSALARINSEGWADRFEFYWRGFEIANAFHELNDPEEQERRFKDEVETRKRLGTRAIKPDWEFLEYLKAGMPPASGIALGVERLLLACQNQNELSKIRAFSFTRPY